MHELVNLIAATNVVADTKVPIIFPSYWFGIIAGGIFLFFGVVTWTYRDVANRHAHKAATTYHDDHEHGSAGPHK